ncbi:hypothetical protein RUM43_010384 [Polyplax serrata]|uniref:Uncharacterized protein n=1 Tax=Polyplax serrata TaxID=468196 RepID=A0AAN8PVR0_POLSC
MKFEEAEPNSSAFGGFPFDLSAVCLNVTKKPQWHPVSKFMAPAPGPSDRENRALIPSSPPAGGKRTRPNWPPSIRREEANVLSSLKKRLGYYKVRNTSTFKTILTKEDREDENLVGEENEMTVRGSSEQTPGDAAHKTDLLKPSELPGTETVAEQKRKGLTRQKVLHMQISEPTGSDVVT